jgi:hypothetical protein
MIRTFSQKSSNQYICERVEIPVFFAGVFTGKNAGILHNPFVQNF